VSPALYAKVFPDPLIVEWLTPWDEQGGRRVFKVLADHRMIRQDGSVDLVPKGLTSDGASLPRILWRFESPYGRVLEAAVHHDRRYRLKIGTRKEADDLFLEGMKALGIPAWKRQILYLGVRAGGGRGWGS